MLSRIRARFTYANVAMTFALVFAMTGGAYAAGKILITSTKQISPKVLKALAGKRGAAGLEGKAGAPGTNGKEGTAGLQGEKGGNGANGVSPIGAAFNGAAHGCTAGGVEYKGATTNYVCNGKEGAEGQEGLAGSTGSTGPKGATGSPWTLEGKLPAGKTVMGHWAATGFGEAAVPNAGFGVASTGVSFPLPLGASPAATYIKEGEPTPAHCAGDVKAPGPPDPGFLCIFVEEESNISTSIFPVSSATNGGFTIFAASAAKGAMYLFGTWAVTAE